MTKSDRYRFSKLGRAVLFAPFVLLTNFLEPQPASAQDGDLSHTPEIWLQEVTDISFKVSTCHYDFPAFRKITLDLCLPKISSGRIRARKRIGAS